MCVAKLHGLARTKFVTPLAEALASIGMHNLNLAFQRLSDAIEHRTNFINLLAVDPYFDPLRKDFRFRKLLRKLQLTS